MTPWSLWCVTAVCHCGVLLNSPSTKQGPGCPSIVLSAVPLARRLAVVGSRANFCDGAIRGRPPPHPIRLGFPSTKHIPLSTARVLKHGIAHVHTRKPALAKSRSANDDFSNKVPRFLKRPKGPGKPRVFWVFAICEPDHRLHFVAFSFEIFIGGFNGHPATKLAKSEIGNMIFEQKREETKSVVYSKTQKTLGFPGHWKRPKGHTGSELRAHFEARNSGPVLVRRCVFRITAPECRRWPPATNVGCLEGREIVELRRRT